jgi:hypothetical protein
VRWEGVILALHPVRGLPSVRWSALLGHQGVASLRGRALAVHLQRAHHHSVLPVRSPCAEGAGRVFALSRHEQSWQQVYKLGQIFARRVLALG